MQFLKDSPPRHKDTKFLIKKYFSLIINNLRCLSKNLHEIHLPLQPNNTLHIMEKQDLDKTIADIEKRLYDNLTLEISFYPKDKYGDELKKALDKIGTLSGQSSMGSNSHAIETLGQALNFPETQQVWHEISSSNLHYRPHEWDECYSDLMGIQKSIMKDIFGGSLRKEVKKADNKNTLLSFFTLETPQGTININNFEGRGEFGNQWKHDTRMYDENFSSKEAFMKNFPENGEQMWAAFEIVRGIEAFAKEAVLTFEYASSPEKQAKILNQIENGFAAWKGTEVSTQRKVANYVQLVEENFNHGSIPFPTNVPDTAKIISRACANFTAKT